MQPIRLFLAGASLAVLPLLAPSPLQQASAQDTKPGVERLYILNCGEGVAGDISRWSPGVNVGKSMDFVDSCYLIKHRAGLAPVGHRAGRRHCRHAGGSASRRPAGDSLAAAEDPCLATRSTRT